MAWIQFCSALHSASWRWLSVATDAADGQGLATPAASRISGCSHGAEPRWVGMKASPKLILCLWLEAWQGSPVARVGTASSLRVARGQADQSVSRRKRSDGSAASPQFRPPLLVKPTLLSLPSFSPSSVFSLPGWLADLPPSAA